MKLRPAWPGGLSSRLLLLTALFVMLAEALILSPTLAAFEEQQLGDSVLRAELIATIIDVAPNQQVSDAVSNRLLARSGLLSISLSERGVRSLILAAPRLERFPSAVDLRNENPLIRWARPWWTLFSVGPNRTLRVIATPRTMQGDFVEIVVPEEPLARALRGFLWRNLAAALFLGIAAGAAVYFALVFFLVRPIGRITRAMERFAADPSDPAATLPPSGRRDEIGRAEAELGRMQGEIRQALASRARLAALGEAVAKINHDLRNMLTSAQMASDRLAALGDPQVSQALPRLERALDRAVKLAEGVLQYGRSEEPAPERVDVPIAAAVIAAADDAGLKDDGVRLESAVPAEATVRADAEQLHRLLVNLMRNARQAIEGAAEREGRGRVAVSYAREAEAVMLRLADDGPGLNERAVARLFQPFAGSGGADGAGLGLAISRELAQGHGGDLTLAENGPGGAVFEVRLPA